MAQFTRCRGKAYCVETPDGCRTCGRSLIEIDAARALAAHWNASAAAIDQQQLNSP